MRFRLSDNFHFGETCTPIEVSAEGWIAQTKFWARASGAISLLAGGAIMLFADWNVTGMPPQFYIALIWAGPAILYFAASFFLERSRGNMCAIVGFFAAGHALATLVAPLPMDYNPIAAMIQPIGMADSREMMPWYLLLAFALCAGLVNLMVSAFWAWRAIRRPEFGAGGRRGFEVMDKGK